MMFNISSDDSSLKPCRGDGNVYSCGRERESEGDPSHMSVYKDNAPAGVAITCKSDPGRCSC